MTSYPHKSQNTSGWWQTTNSPKNSMVSVSMLEKAERISQTSEEKKLKVSNRYLRESVATPKVGGVLSSIIVDESEGLPVKSEGAGIALWASLQHRASHWGDTDRNGTIKIVQDKEFYFQRQNKGTRFSLSPETKNRQNEWNNGFSKHWASGNKGQSALIDGKQTR